MPNLHNFYYVLSYAEIHGNGEYLVLEEYALHNHGRSGLPDHPPSQDLIDTHQREGYQFDGWSVVEIVAGDMVPSWPLAFKLDRE